MTIARLRAEAEGQALSVMFTTPCSSAIDSCFPFLVVVDFLE